MMELTERWARFLAGRLGKLGIEGEGKTQVAIRFVLQSGVGPCSGVGSGGISRTTNEDLEGSRRWAT
jgi:hypothetical protein